MGDIRHAIGCHIYANGRPLSRFSPVNQEGRSGFYNLNGDVANSEQQGDDHQQTGEKGANSAEPLEGLTKTPKTIKMDGSAETYK